MEKISTLLFTPYALPAIVALLAKIGMFFYAQHSKVHSVLTRLYLLFLFSLAIQNIAEVTFFITNGDGVRNNPEISGYWYFGASIAAIAFLLHLALVSTAKAGDGANIPTLGVLSIYLPAVVLSVLLWSTPLLIAGFQPMSYTITKVPGSLYFLFELYAISYLSASAALLIYGAITQNNPFRRLQNKFLILGLLPTVILVVLVISLQRLGLRAFNTTATLPFAITFFLAVTAYATHQHRLFDIEFFMPWSKVRKRKTAFYNRIRAVIAEIASMNTAHKVVHSLSEALRCPVAIVGGPKPALALAGEAFGLARFPIEQLKKIDHILVANEIAQAMPDTFQLMKRHKVAAIVPFHPHSQTAASWMLLGDTFSEQVYSPLDFQVVETLFARLADHFLDNQLLLRSQLVEAKQEMEELRHRLANAWDLLEATRKELSKRERKEALLWEKRAGTLHRNLATVQADALDRLGTKTKSLDEYVTEFEACLIAKTLEHCEDDASRAAETLGIPLATLYYKIRQFHLTNLNKKNN